MEKIKQDFQPITWVLIPAAIVINGAVGWIVAKLDLPLYLDTIGTVFISVAAGPWVGAITGVLSNLILGFFSPGFIPYWPVSVLIGLAAGFLANAGWFKSWWKVLLAGLVISVAASTTSALIAMRIHGNADLNLSYFLLNEPIDKILTALIVFAATQILPKWILTLLPRRENVTSEEN